VGSVLAGAIVYMAEPMMGTGDAYRLTFIFAGLMVLVAVVLLQTVKPERARVD